MQPEVTEIVVQWRQRQAWHSAEKILTLQAKALCRGLVGGDRAEAAVLYAASLGKGEHPSAAMALGAIGPIIDGRAHIQKARKQIEKRLTAAAMTLPVAFVVEATRGFGYLGLAAIVGEAGDLAAYATHSKLWKRMGLAVMPGGDRQRRMKDADEALAHGYSPKRRSVVWTIGAALVKAGGPYKAIYDARKVYEAGRVATKGHAHARAQRYIEKRLLRDLWRAWRAAIRALPREANDHMPLAFSRLFPDVDERSGMVTFNRAADATAPGAPVAGYRVVQTSES